MNKEEKEAIERLDRKLTSEKFTKNIGMPVYIKDVEIVLNLIQKQDKIIDKMAEKMVEDTEWFYSKFDNYTKQDFIEYFKKVVDKDVKDKRTELT